MHVQQMTERCPNSVLLGRGILSSYRWQINERGVANIVPSKDDSVEGLVFKIDQKAERNLDVYEGVKSGVYQKAEFTVLVDLLPHGDQAKLGFDGGDGTHASDHPEHLGASGSTGTQSTQHSHVLRQESEDTSREPKLSERPAESGKVGDERNIPTKELAAASQTSISGSAAHRSAQDLLGAPDPGNNLASHASAEETPGTTKPVKVNALVYFSEKYNKDGTMREEYRNRMRNAANDAEKYGVSQDSVLVIRKFIKHRSVVAGTSKVATACLAVIVPTRVGTMNTSLNSKRPQRKRKKRSR